MSDCCCTGTLSINGVPIAGALVGGNISGDLIFTDNDAFIQLGTSTAGDAQIRFVKADANVQTFMLWALGTALADRRWDWQHDANENLNFRRRDLAGANPYGVFSLFYSSGNNAAFRTRRNRADLGTTVTFGAWALVGFGAGAGVATPGTPKDQGGRVELTVGTGPAANPTATFTFVDGAYTSAPVAAVVRNGGTGLAGHTWTTTTTTLVITIVGPVEGETYFFEVPLT